MDLLAARIIEHERVRLDISAVALVDLLELPDEVFGRVLVDWDPPRHESPGLQGGHVAGDECLPAEIPATRSAGVRGPVAVLDLGARKKLRFNLGHLRADGDAHLAEVLVRAPA